MQVYTRKGDNGSTRLYGTKKRFLKSDPIFECLGDFDELNALIGVLRTQPSMKKYKDFLLSIQEDILTISSVVAGFKPENSSDKYFSARVREIEALVDEISEDLPDLTDFVLPGVNVSESYSHLARAVCRRAERKFVGFSIESNTKNVAIQSYINRLSDLLFVLALHNGL